MLAYIPAALTTVALAFNLANLFALRAWRRQRLRIGGPLPVSVLKPLKGCDPKMYEAFRSHCIQDFTAPYEIIFGVNDPSDEAVPYVEQLKDDFPEADLSLVVCSEVLGANRKVSNLAQMVKHAKHAHLVVNDSDITVPRDYLARITRKFGDPKVGMVTCLYRAVPGKGIWSRIEALGVLLDFMPGALTARMIEGRVGFGLGSTMAVSREALEKAGGFEALVDHLADDYELANHIVHAGYTVALPGVVVETQVPAYDLQGFWQHQLRWGRTVRSSRFAGYLGLFVTFGLLWALLWFAMAGLSPYAVAGLVAVLVLRLVVLRAYSRALEDEVTARSWWLIPLRDLISPLVWLCSIAGSKIVWRGEHFHVRSGRLERI